ncbi:putative protein phosphatase 2C 43, partial [Bienertia sinuspersici]
ALFWWFISPNDDEDFDIWSVDLKRHFLGKFSMAVCQANEELEDRSQIEAGKHATFVGIYDGHGGRQAANYVLNNLFKHFIEHIIRAKVMSEPAIRHAIAVTEQGFIEAVRGHVETQPHIASVGCCCVIAVIWRSRLYVANLGNSQAVIAHRRPSDGNTMHAEPLTFVHHIDELQTRTDLFDDQPSEITPVDGVYPIRNRIQVSRSIGDAYLKYPELAVPDLPIKKPVLTAEPTRVKRALRQADKFLIFASSGLWDHFSLEEAVEFVRTHCAKGIAKKLVKEAQKRAAEKVGMTYEQVKTAVVGQEKRQIHNDITVVVIFLDHKLLKEERRGPGRFSLCRAPPPQLDESIIGFSNQTSQSLFHRFTWPPNAGSAFHSSFTY